MNHEFDAIVIGSGITGGWAAKELTEKGLKTLLIDRARMVEHQKDYPTEGKSSFNLPYRGMWPPSAEAKKRFNHSSVVTNPTNYHFFNDDRTNPYVNNKEKPFWWVRADIFGGRSIVWGRQCYRWSDLDFRANKKDGNGIDWPVRYKDIEPWYSYVENFIGVQGEKLSLEHLPDGEFLPPMDLNIAEKHFKDKVEKQFQGRVVTIGRSANLTTSKPAQKRSQCMYRNQCDRGCSFGAYFSTQSSTLPAAVATGNLTIKPNALVKSLEYDREKKRITGVKVIDTLSKKKTIYSSRIVFLCASAVSSTQILMCSRSDSMQYGLGNNDVLGRYLMDHTFGTGATGVLPGYTEYMEYGRRPTGMYIPRFRNINDKETRSKFVRGYNFQSWNGGRKPTTDYSGFGINLKEKLRIPGPWTLPLYAFCEVLPSKENRMFLDKRKKDRFGIPLVNFDFAFKENEFNMLDDATDQAVKMLKTAGCIDINVRPNVSPPGTGIHEMGGARMGDNPEESVVNRWNQHHHASNLFITDGAAMTSASCVNPSITYMAFTARAANHAVDLIKTHNI
jgi:choline dehydrogenase-like flavoprotein